jgi:hypothetical protein|tara:strand:- start:215 stop:655 length:441 start_codon:yes stop_codon:yes gene_type:complete
MAIGLFAKSVLHSAKGMKKLGSILQKRSRSPDKIFLKTRAAKKYVKTLEKGNILQRRNIRSSIKGVQAMRSEIGISPSKSNLGIAKQFSRMGKTAKKKRYTMLSSKLNPRIEKQGGMLTGRKNYKTIMKMSKSPEYAARIGSKFIL